MTLGASSTTGSTFGSRLAAADRGCLVLADISGYTTYLLSSELEHAQDVLADLMNIVVGNLQPVLQVSKLEGDAAFAYVLDGGYAPSTVLDAVEQTYFAFRSRLRDIKQATTCTCQACELMPILDLKFVVHEGSFVRHRVGQGEELIGSDVILAHRLLKNSASEALGTHGYLLLSEASVQGLGLDPEALGLHPHLERYDDVGEIRCWLENLDERWRLEQQRRQVYVRPEDSSFEVSFTLPAAPPVAWDWLTSPEKRALWQADRVDQVTPGGRLRSGNTNHCIHGAEVVVEEILDWRPFHYYTMRYPLPAGQMTWTWELRPTVDGTAVSIRGEPLTGPRRAAWDQMAPMMLERLETIGPTLATMLASTGPGTAGSVLPGGPQPDADG